MMTVEQTVKSWGTGAVDPTVLSTWDTTLHQQGGQSVFQTAAWAAVLKETFGHKPLYLVNDSAQGTSLWPLMEVDSFLTGRRGISLPFTDECEPRFCSSAIAEKLLEEALEIGSARRWRYFEFRGGAHYFPQATPSVSYFTHELPLNGEINDVMQRFDGAVRRAIRKGIQLGLKTAISQSWSAMECFFKLHCLTRKKHGVPPQPISFFSNIHRHLITAGKGFIAIAKHNEKPVAAGVFFHVNGNVLYKFGASDEKYQHLRGSNLMMFAAIQHCLSLKSRTLHFGRTSRANEGLRRYKLGWGTQERQLDYLRYDLRKRAFVTSRDDSSGWHTQVFRRLPCLISQGIGTALYKHLA